MSASFTSYYVYYKPETQRPLSVYTKPNGRSQKTIRKRARFIRSQHQKLK